MHRALRPLLVTCLAVPVLFAPGAVPQAPSNIATGSTASPQVRLSTFVVAQRGSPDYRRGYRIGRSEGFREGWKEGRRTCRREDRVRSHDAAAPDNDYDRGWADGQEFGFTLGFDRAYERYCG